MTERVVWVANESGHDYEPAARYGPTKSLSIGNQNTFQLDRLAYHLSRGIGQFTHEDDYLLVSGSPIINMLAFNFWLLRHSKCNLLQWKASTREYILTTVSRDQMASLMERSLHG